MPRAPYTFHFIYKTTCLLNGKYYIGLHSANSLDDGYLGSGRRLKCSVNKYGRENHKREILKFASNRKELFELEKEVVNEQLLAEHDCMNLMPGGRGGQDENGYGYCRVTFDQRNNKGIQRIRWLFENDKEWRQRCSEATRKRLKQLHREGKIKYDTFKGKKHSDETKNKMSVAKSGTQTGIANSQFGTCWICSDEQKQNKKISRNELDDWLCKGWQSGRKMKF